MKNVARLAAVCLGLGLTTASCFFEAEIGIAGDLCNGPVDCTPGNICWNSICVTDGVMRFSLAWNVTSDFDLHVRTPLGHEIYFSNDSADGGVLDVDDCVFNGCRRPSGTHVENVYWAATPPSGTYEIWVENYNGSAAGDFTLEVFGATAGPFAGSLPATSDAESTHFTVTY
jgi:hypothetical protein